MDQERDAVEMAETLSASVYPRHKAVIDAVRLQRGQRNGRIPKISAIVQEGIEEVGRRELGPERFSQLMAGTV